MGCPGANSPSSPAPSGLTNTSTFTPTGSWTPSASPTKTPSTTATDTPTPTATRTATNTPTQTLSRTSTNSPTETPTKTPSDTATGTPTPTLSRTATDTPTVTQTFTPSSTATDSSTPTETSTSTDTVPASPTNSPTDSPTATITRTPSNTPTETVTRTPTLCPTSSPTATPGANGYSISGTVNYTGGSGTVSGTHPIAVVAFDPNNGNSAPHAVVTTNNSSYTITGLVNGKSYTIVTFFNPSVAGFYWSPPPGSYAGLYGTSLCSPSSSPQVTVTGDMTGIDLAFDNTNILNGYGGTASYSGSAGKVDQCHGIIVATYPAGTGIGGIGSVSNSDTTFVNTDGGSFYIIGGNGGGSVCVTQNQDILAYFDKAGTGNIQTGDPYVFLGSQDSSTSPSFTLSIDDTNIY